VKYYALECEVVFSLIVVIIKIYEFEIKFVIKRAQHALNRLKHIFVNPNVRFVTFVLE
jgi:hypothetical protein